MTLVEPEGVACDHCGLVARDHLECGDPCCRRCSHPDWVAPPQLGRLLAENDAEAATPEVVSPLKRRALTDLIRNGWEG